MRNRLRSAISIALIALYAMAGIGGDALHYLLESPDAADSSAPAAPTGQAYVHRHGHGPGDHWHFHQAAYTQQDVRDVVSAEAPRPAAEGRPCFAAADSHQHSCLLLALVSTLELTLAAVTSDLGDTLPVLQAAWSPSERGFSPGYGSHSARGPPLSPMA